MKKKKSQVSLCFDVSLHVYASCQDMVMKKVINILWPYMSRSWVLRLNLWASDSHLYRQTILCELSRDRCCSFPKHSLVVVSYDNVFIMSLRWDLGGFITLWEVGVGTSQGKKVCILWFYVAGGTAGSLLYSPAVHVCSWSQSVNQRPFFLLHRFI